MQFEVAERIDTDRGIIEVIGLALDQFKKVSESVKVTDDYSFVAKSIEATFGSINRSDKTQVSVKKLDGGWLLTAEVAYGPSFMFWVFALLALFTYVGWIIPVIFYLVQRTTVKNAVASCLKRVADELRRPAYAGGLQGTSSAPSAIDELEKLAGLKERGFITDEEFAAKKVQLLRRAA
jgi:hypothetical protein